MKQYYLAKRKTIEQYYHCFIGRRLPILKKTNQKRNNPYNCPQRTTNRVNKPLELTKGFCEVDGYKINKNSGIYLQQL